MTPHDVCLVQMPYSAIVRPSISLGLLKAYLDEIEIDARVVYANLDFAEIVGVEVYRLIESTAAQDLIGEWTFSAAAFGDEVAGNGYLERAGFGFGGPFADLIRKTYGHVDIAALLHEVRRAADDFVTEIAREVLAHEPRIVGATSMFQQQCASLALLRKIKAMAPDVVTMLGGPNLEGPMGAEVHRAFTWVDYVASGEADEYFAELCRWLLEEGTDYPLERTPQSLLTPLRRQAGQGAEVSNEHRGVVTQLDKLAFPEFGDYFARLAVSPLAPYITPALSIETSRGCWWGEKRHCTFCGLNGAGMVYRKKSAERAFAEIEALTDRYGVFNLSPADNILEMSYFDTLLPQLAEAEEPYAIFYEVKPNLKKKHIEILAASGARWVQPGIESLHDGILELLGKGVSALHNIQLLKYAMEVGVRLEYYLLYGAPGEQDDWHAEVAARVPDLVHLQPPNMMGRIRYDRFSPYHSDPDRFGITLTANRSYSYVFPLDAEGLRNVAYYFEDYADLGRGRIGPAEDGSFRGEGLKTLMHKIQGWRDAFVGKLGSRPKLEGVREGDVLVVTDTRPIAVAARHEVAGVELAVLEACDDRMTRTALPTRLARGGGAVDVDAADAALASLLRKRLVLEIDGKLLSLVIPPARAEVPKIAFEPAGLVDHRAAVDDPDASRFASRLKPQPKAMPISAMFGGKGSKKSA